jgi:hypothetical protein
MLVQAAVGVDTGERDTKWSILHQCSTFDILIAPFWPWLSHRLTKRCRTCSPTKWKLHACDGPTLNTRNGTRTSSLRGCGRDSLAVHLEGYKNTCSDNDLGHNIEMTHSPRLTAAATVGLH